MGDALAEEVKRVLEEKKLSVDVVIPVCLQWRCEVDVFSYGP